MQATIFLYFALAAAPLGFAAAHQPASPPPAQSSAAALGLYVFPAKNQSADQQKQDEQPCYVWARDQSGIDPAAVKASPDSALVRAMNKRDTLVAIVTSVPALANGGQQRVDPSGAIAAYRERPYVCA
jgi:hypothetical protein